MAKDPAVLIYISQWLTSTAGMDADARGWYFNLMLHNYDKEGLPNDIEILAQLAGVKFSEFDRFKQVLEQVLKQKFVLNEANGLLENPKTMDMLKSRGEFKEKRARSGNIGVVMKAAAKITGFNKKLLLKLKGDLYTFSDEEIEEAKSEQMLKQMLKLYINEDVDVNKDINSNKDKAIESYKETGCKFESVEFKKSWIEIIGSKKWKSKEQSAINKSLKQLMKYEEPFALALVDKAIAGGYQGVTFDATDINYQKYLSQKDGKSNSRESAIESRSRMAELATAILTGNSA